MRRRLPLYSGWFFAGLGLATVAGGAGVVMVCFAIQHLPLPETKADEQVLGYLCCGAAASFVLMVVAGITAFVTARARAGQCAWCGYSRKGLAPEAKCPECGEGADRP